MATPPKKPTGTTPPRRKAAARKATPPKAPKAEAVEDSATPPETAKPATPAAPKKPRAPRGAAADKAPAKPRTTKRAEPVRTPARQRVADSAPVQYVTETREKMGDRNFFAAVLGATAAVGAAVAGLVLALRSGRADGEERPGAGATAHQADGTDSSAQFEAGIADEGMIPDKLPEA